MPTDPKKRQKKLARKEAKRKEKRQAIAREQTVSIPDRIRASTSAPILDCFVSSTLFGEEGIGWVLVSRELQHRKVALGAFLIDRFCLGVKNALADVRNRSDYERRFVERIQGQNPQEIDLAKARKIVNDAVDYARSIGFSPHDDYHRAVLIFGDEDGSSCEENFEFGKDGAPHYMSGPNDSEERIQQIIHTLNQTCGEGNYHFVIADPRSFKIRPRKGSVSVPAEESSGEKIEQEVTPTETEEPPESS